MLSAVAGFSIEMECRGEIWPTDSHPTSETQEYPLQRESFEGVEENLVVSIGILRDIVSEVEGDLGRHGLADSSRLHIKGEIPIASPQQANIAVRTIKELISHAMINNECKQIHLFFAGPAFLALFLGHRLNATAPIQCYERVSVGHYVPTCRLFYRPLGTTKTAPDHPAKPHPPR